MALCGILRQSTAMDVLLGPMVSVTDATPMTALTIDVEVSKNGEALAEKSDATAPTHDAGQEVDGYYNCELDATDTNTVGTLTLVASATDALSIRQDYLVVEEAVYDLFFAAGSTGAVTVAAIASGAITAAAIATGAIDADALAADTITAAKVAADVTTELQSGLATAAALATVATFVDTEVASILAAVDTEIAAIKTVTDALPDAGALTSLATAAALGTVDTVVDAIKVKTDQLNFGVTGKVDSNVTHVNETEVTGNGELGTEWGPA